ncbi:tRNA (guanosine-2'-O-)-methyltransferase [Salegentibacter agarivorans]|jgi:tRNA (guanosine-2'-O-)-methyltransferase|uniref:tRNA (guanosine(18)-2'-O)-methyltransferase n=1 Tax=Salegentibacter agarivorans TaxID=345907 RepID=A0A1I2Q1Q9_9FLAO|nr:MULTISPECIES: RNA methyltransferase [Salegentibacter]APS39900.1 rRNA methyltransferase [Salegentibacter sp. T436]SFG21299.1 tRNA (guanosine-2'-O-)-methyltransferase [Salegentibacter agarivorans]
MQKTSLIEHLETFLTPRRIALFDKVIAERTNHFTVATQDVYQLHNTSAVIRSCEVFGIQNIHVIEERKPKRIDREIAMGAQKWVDVNRYSTSKECIQELRKKGYQIVATTPYGESTALKDFNIEKPSAIFFGTEKEGLSDETLNEADCRLNIPMFGFTESLNISVSAAIILQSITSRLKSSEINWQLSEEDKINLKYEWLKKCIKNSDSIIAQFNTENH